MFKYIAKRIAYSIFILIGVSMIIYFLIRLMPVDFIQSKINAINQGGATVSEETVKAMQKYGCPMDYVLKDITTVSCKPQNLIVWAETVSLFIRAWITAMYGDKWQKVLPVVY